MAVVLVEGAAAMSDAPLMSLAFTLPWAPSVNHYYRTLTKGKLAGRTLISEAGRKYRTAAILSAREQRVPTDALHGRIAVAITAHPPDRRARDLDNMLKALLDALHHARVIADDADIDDLHIVRGRVLPGGRLTLIVSEIAHEPTPLELAFAQVPSIVDDALKTIGAPPPF